MVQTSEKLNIPADIGGLMFPKNGQFALRGIMVTNFGHVDPGYKGHLKYTIINFGADPYRIEIGQRITSLTLYRMNSKADPDWSVISKHDPDKMEGHAKVLSRDFLDIENRVVEMVKTHTKQAIQLHDSVRSFWVPLMGLVATFLIAIVAVFMPFYMHLDSKIDSIVKHDYNKYSVAAQEDYEK